MGRSDEHAATPPPPLRAALATRARRWASDRDVSHRFLSPPMVALIAVYLFFTISYASYSVDNDGGVYLGFMRRLTGQSAAAPPTHQFGSAVFALPFFLVARLLGLAGVESIGGAPLEQVSMVVATTVALLLLSYLGWLLLRWLDLPGGPGLLALAVVGTPLFYYAVFQATYKHVIDTLYIVVATVLLFRVLRRRSAWLFVALGACLALSIVTRTANAAIVPGMLLPIVLRRDLRGALLVLVAAVAAGAVLFAVPKLTGAGSVGIALPHLEVISSGNVAATTVAVHNLFLCKNYTYYLTFRQCLLDRFGIWPDPAAPFKMLFSLHRGLFLWTPLTALGVVGYVLLVRRRKDERHFLLGLGVAMLCLWYVHMLWGQFWDGGFAFSQRFLSGLFPVFLLGCAELVRRRRVVAYTALSLCAAFSLMLAFTFEAGFKGINRHDGVGQIVHLYTTGQRTPQQLVRKLGVQARDRWLGH